jgi:hypothetical protein
MFAQPPLGILIWNDRNLRALLSTQVFRVSGLSRFSVLQFASQLGTCRQLHFQPSMPMRVDR